MSVFNSILGAFGAGSANQQQQQQQQQPPAPQQFQQQQQQAQQGNPPAPQYPPMELNPAMPNQQSQMNGQTNGQGASPLDQFSDIFTPKATDPNAPAAVTSAVSFDPAAVQQQVGQMDFMKLVKPEDLQAVAAGGEGAMAAMGNMMNTMMRQVVMMNTQFAAQSANKAADFAYSRSRDEAPSWFRGQMTQSEFDAPEHNHPALKPMIQALTTQFQTQFPRATPKEVAQHVQTYLGTVGGVFAPKDSNQNSQQQNTQQQPAQDWGNWFQ